MNSWVAIWCRLPVKVSTNGDVPAGSINFYGRSSRESVNLSSGLPYVPAQRCVWNIGFLCSKSWRKLQSCSCKQQEYSKPEKGNRSGRKDVKWICDLFMCDMWLSPVLSDGRHSSVSRPFMRYRDKLIKCLTVSKCCCRCSTPFFKEIVLSQTLIFLKLRGCAVKDDVLIEAST